MRPYSRVYATVNLDAVASNMRSMRDNLPASTLIMGSVKADGYGHGSVPVAKTIEPYVFGYAVATIDGGIILRRHGINKTILILGVTHESRYEDLLRYDIRTAKFQYEKAKKLSDLALKQGKKAVVHLALDTGMSRIGMKADREHAKEAAAIAALEGIEVEGLFTHFARADETDKSAYEEQYRRNKEFLGYLKELGVKIPIRHCSNSAGIVESLESNHMDMVRAGIAFFGAGCRHGSLCSFQDIAFLRFAVKNTAGRKPQIILGAVNIRSDISFSNFIYNMSCLQGCAFANHKAVAVFVD